MLASNNYCPKSRPFPQQNIFLLEGGNFYDTCFKLDLRSLPGKARSFPADVFSGSFGDHRLKDSFPVSFLRTKREQKTCEPRAQEA